MKILNNHSFRWDHITYFMGSIRREFKDNSTKIYFFLNGTCHKEFMYDYMLLETYGFYKMSFNLFGIEHNENDSSWLGTDIKGGIRMIYGEKV